ncbi:ribonuclease H-like domain-containing protein, partial [Mycena floridula]
MSSFTLCDTEAAAQAAIAIISSCDMIALDCEAQNLGTRGGRLSLINIRTMSSLNSSTFMFDVLRLEKSILRPLFDILESESIIKVMFDCRMDFSALYHEEAVTLRNVLDMQVADIASRQGESLGRQIERLGSFYPYGVNTAFYKDVHALSGLARCLEEHCGIARTDGRVDHQQWLHRPLSSSNLSYAAEDVKLIAALYERFVQNALIGTELHEQSARYLSLHRQRQPNNKDFYARNGLFPLEIL